jgi:hypothetical protein
MRTIRVIAWIIAWLIAFVCALWATGALYFDFQIPALRPTAAIIFVLALLAAAILLRGKLLKLGVFFVGFAVVLGWWLTLKPSNDRAWQPDVSETGWAEVNGDDVTLHNVRNCDYRTETNYTPHWETRTVKLSQLSGLGIAITYWGSPYMAHPIVSFEVADSTPICFSIETRKEIGEDYSAIGGLYRQYELIYICSDERDVIRLRTNYRKGEDVYLYRVLASPDEVRERFREYVKTLNALHVRPRWYNAVTTNCTTSIRAQHPTNQRTPWDWRILVNGKGDELLYERHLVATGGLPFAELKQRSYINERARAADQDPDFWRRIREGLPSRD